LGALLTQLKGPLSLQTLSTATDINRYTLSRWLKGTAHPSLPDFLLLVEVTSRRLIDLVARWVPPERLPSLRRRWRELEKAREIAYEQPWAHAVLRALQLDAYRDGRARGRDWIARRLGLDAERVEAALSALSEAGQIRRERGRYRAVGVESLATGADPVRARRLKLDWTHVAAERLEAGLPGTFGFSLFEVSGSDLRKLRDLQREYVRAMQQIIARSQGTDRIGLYCAQLLDLSVDDNALADDS
jgi:hypothetical protein